MWRMRPGEERLGRPADPCNHAAGGDLDGAAGGADRRLVVYAGSCCNNIGVKQPNGSRSA